MKQTRFSIQTMASLLLIGVVFCGCADDLGLPEYNEGTYTLSVETSKSLSVTTRALNENGSTLTATWATTDHIYVKKGSTWATGSLQPKTAGTTATLRGSLSGITINPGDNLILQSPKSDTPDYTIQGGNLDNIASYYDYATATATVTSVDNGKVTATATTFTTQQAIVKFTLIDKTDGTTPMNATELIVNDGTNDYLVSPTFSSTNVLYVAIPGFTNKTITLTATVNGETYTYEKSGVTFTILRYYWLTMPFPYPLHLRQRKPMLQ